MSGQTGSKVELFRAMHQGPPILLLPNAWDAASAKLFVKAGARAIATTSAGIAAVLGYPDGEKIPRELMMEAVARIASAVDVPVTADVEAGYGPTAKDVAETTLAVIRAGAVGINLEDAKGDPSDALFEIAEQVERIRAARTAAKQASADVVINARTDVYFMPGGEPAEKLREAVRRANAYRSAGADCLFVPGVVDLATLTELVREISGPVSVLAGPGTPSAADLQRIGVARVSVGSGIMRATLALARDIANEILQKGTYAKMLERSIPYAEVNELMK